MAVKHISILKTETFHLLQNPITKEFVLWDDVKKFNISLHEKTERDTFLYALKYYQKRLKEVETNFKNLELKVNTFIESVLPESED